MSDNDREIELKPLLNSPTEESSNEFIDSDGTVPGTQTDLQNEVENHDPSTQSCENDQLSGNDDALPSIDTSDLISLNDGPGQPSTSEDADSSMTGEDAGSSMTVQNVVEVMEEAERVPEELQGEVNDVTEDASLVAAVKSGSCEDVQRHLTNGASPRSVDHASRLSCAQLATMAGYAVILQKLLHHSDLEEHNADVFEVDSNQKTLLHLAVEGKHYDCLEILVQKGSLNRVDSNRESPLYAAVKVSWTAGVSLLLAAGADVQGTYGEEPQKTVLYLAVLSKDFETLKAIVSKVTQCNDCDRIVNAILNNETPLCMAIKLKWTDAVRLILDAGGNPQKPVLHLAVLSKDLEMLTAVVTAVNLLDDKEMVINDTLGNKTPLFMAVESEWTEAVQLLLTEGADLRVKYSGKTLLQYYVVHRRCIVEIFRAITEQVSLLEDCAQVIDAKFENKTPLMAAVRLGRLEYVRALVKAGADVTVMDNDSRNLLHCAALHGQIRSLKMLFKLKRMEMEQLVTKRETVTGVTPLQIAVQQGSAECIQFLLKKWTTDDFGKDNMGRNLLHLASENYKPNIIDIFTTNLYKPNDISNLPNRLRALLHQTTDAGDTPLLYALQKRRSEFLIALIMTGSDLIAKSKEMNDRTAIDILIYTMPGSVKILTDVLDRSISKPKNAEYVTVSYRVLMPYKGEHQNTRGPGSGSTSAPPSAPAAATPLAAAPATPSTPATTSAPASAPATPSAAVTASVTPSAPASAPDSDPKPDPDHGFSVVNTLRETSGNLLGQKKILEHPLVASYLYEHWKIIRGPYMTLVTLSYIFAFCLSIFISFVKPYLENKESAPGFIGFFWVLVSLTLILPMILIFLHEVQCIGHLNRWSYRFESCVKFICFALTIWVFFPGSPPESAAIAVLLANFELIAITSRIPGWGLYMLMFIEVTKKYITLLISFALVIFGFSVAFFVTFRSAAPFETVPWSLMKTVVMMTNEFEYENLRNFTSTGQLRLSPSPQISAMTILILFIICVSFVLTNLLVAVAVIKVKKLHRISKQVDFLSNYWRLLLHPPKWWRFKYGLMQALFKFQQKVRRNMGGVSTNKAGSAQLNSSQAASSDANCGQTTDAEANSGQREAGGNEVCENRKIYMAKKSRSSYKRRLYRELVLKGIEDRARLTKMYQERDERNRERANRA